MAVFIEAGLAVGSGDLLGHNGLDSELGHVLSRLGVSESIGVVGLVEVMAALLVPGNPVVFVIGSAPVVRGSGGDASHGPLLFIEEGVLSRTGALVLLCGTGRASNAFLLEILESSPRIRSIILCYATSYESTDFGIDMRLGLDVNEGWLLEVGGRARRRQSGFIELKGSRVFRTQTLDGRRAY